MWELIETTREVITKVMGVKGSQTKMTRFWNHVIFFLEWEAKEKAIV